MDQNLDVEQIENIAPNLRQPLQVTEEMLGRVLDRLTNDNILPMTKKAILGSISGNVCQFS